MQLFEHHHLSIPLVDSDRVYFEMGATAADLPGARLIYMPEHLDVSPGCVAVLSGESSGLKSACLRLERLETAVRALGARSCRFYDFTSDVQLADAALKRGYRASTEIGLVIETGNPLGQNTIELKPVLDEEDWLAKLRIHQTDTHAPDGHPLHPERWLAIEKCKAASGNLQFFLAYRDGVPCGTVGALRHGGLLRMKNLVVAPELRKQGIGSAITLALKDRAAAMGCCAMGLFGLDAGPALGMYLELGMAPIARQVEWSRTL